MEVFDRFAGKARGASLVCALGWVVSRDEEGNSVALSETACLREAMSRHLHRLYKGSPPVLPFVTRLELRVCIVFRCKQGKVCLWIVEMRFYSPVREIYLLKHRLTSQFVKRV